MIQDVLQTQLAQMLRLPTAPLIVTGEAPLELPEWGPGDKLPAVVLASLPNGRFLAQVGEQTLELNLPKNTEPGEQLQLTYAGNTPRLTFLLDRTSSRVVAPPGEQAQTQAQTQTPSATPASSQSTSTLSDAARLVSSLRQPQAENGHVDSQVPQAVGTAPHRDTSLTGAQSTILRPISAPLLSLQVQDAQEVAGALKQTISESGLFYESHQAQWVMGQRSLVELAREPQASLPPPDSPSLPSEAAIPTQPGNHSPESIVGSSALPYLQAQLEMIDTGVMSWQGQVWPDQDMHWKVARYPEKETGDDRHWQTSLELKMPHLGHLQVYLLLGPQGLQVRCRAEAPQAKEVLDQARGTLAAALANAGLTVQCLTVETNEKT